MGVCLVGERPGVLVHGHGGEPLLLGELIPIGAITTIAVTTGGVTAPGRRLMTMAGIALLMTSGPGIVSHLWIQGSAVAMAIDILAGLAGGEVLGLWHADNGPLAIDLYVDAVVEMGCFPIACGINAVGVTVVTGVLADPLRTCQPGVAVALHADRSFSEIGQGVCPWPIMAALAVGVGRLVGVGGVGCSGEGLAAVMAAVTFAVGGGMAVFGGVDGIGEQQSSLMTGVTGQRVVGVKIQPVSAVGSSIIRWATFAVIMAAVAAGSGEGIHDSAAWDMANLATDPHGEMLRVLAGVAACCEAATMLVAMGAASIGTGSPGVVNLVLMVSCGIGGVVLKVVRQGVTNLAEAVVAGAGVDKTTVWVKELDVVESSRANNRIAN